MSDSVFSQHYNSAQANTPIILPTMGSRIDVKGINLSVPAANSASLSLGGTVIGSTHDLLNVKNVNYRGMPDEQMTINSSGAVSVSVRYETQQVRTTELVTSGLVGRWMLDETTGNVDGNFVTNPGFETYTTSPGIPNSYFQNDAGATTQFTRDTSVTHSPNNAFKILIDGSSGGGANVGIIQDLPTLTAGRSYYLEAWCRTSGAVGENARVRLVNQTDAATILDQTVSTTTIYTKVQCTFKAIAGKTYQIRLTTSGSVGFIAYFDDILVKEIVATDSSGNGNNGVLSGAVNTAGPTIGVAGRTGTAYSFDGTDDYVTIPDSAALSPITTMAYTFSAWASRPASGVADDIAGKASNPYEWQLSWVASNKLQVSLFASGGAGGTVITSTATVSHGAFHHIVWTLALTSPSAGTIKFYIDGAFDSTATFSTGNSLSDTTSPITIGQRGDGVGTGFFAGTIDDPRIYSRALSADEVLTLYNQGLRGQ